MSSHRGGRSQLALDRAVDRLSDLGAVNDDSTRAVGKLVLSFLLAVARVMVNGRLAQTTRKPDGAQPKVLDLSLAILMSAKRLQVSRSRSLSMSKNSWMNSTKNRAIAGSEFVNSTLFRCRDPSAQNS